VSTFVVTLGLLAAWLTPHILAYAWDEWAARRGRERAERRAYLRSLDERIAALEGRGSRR